MTERIIGAPDRTLWVQPQLLESRKDAEPRFAQEVRNWCMVTLGSRWNLADHNCHVKISPTDDKMAPIEFDRLMTLVTFETDADEVAFRLRWL